MKEVRAKLDTAGKKWKYWTWVMQDSVNKYKELAQKSTGLSPYQEWLQVEALNITNLFIFEQLGQMPVMNKSLFEKQASAKRYTI